MKNQPALWQVRLRDGPSGTRGWRGPFRRALDALLHMAHSHGMSGFEMYHGGKVPE